MPVEPARHSVFISYAREDHDWISVAANLLVAGGAKVFMDVRDIAYGDRWEDVLMTTLLEVERVLVFWSRSAARSEWVEKECRIAVHNGKRVVPVPIDDTPLPAILSQFHALTDLKGLLQQGVAKTVPAPLPPPSPRAAPPAKASPWLPYAALAGSAGVAVSLATFYFSLPGDLAIEPPGSHGGGPGSHPARPGLDTLWTVTVGALLVLALLSWRVARRIRRNREQNGTEERFSRHVSPEVDTTTVEPEVSAVSADLGRRVVDMVFESRDHNDVH